MKDWQCSRFTHIYDFVEDLCCTERGGQALMLSSYPKHLTAGGESYADGQDGVVSVVMHGGEGQK